MKRNVINKKISWQIHFLMFNNNITTVLYRDIQNKNIVIHKFLRHYIPYIHHRTAIDHFPRLRCWNHHSQCSVQLSDVVVSIRSFHHRIDVIKRINGRELTQTKPYSIRNTRCPQFTQDVVSPFTCQTKVEKGTKNLQRLFLSKKNKFKRTVIFERFFCPIKIHVQTETVTCAS